MLAETRHPLMVASKRDARKFELSADCPILSGSFHSIKMEATATCRRGRGNERNVPGTCGFPAGRVLFWAKAIRDAGERRGEIPRRACVVLPTRLIGPNTGTISKFGALLSWDNSSRWLPRPPRTWHVRNVPDLIESSSRIAAIGSLKKCKSGQDCQSMGVRYIRRMFESSCRTWLLRRLSLSGYYRTGTKEKPIRQRN